MFILISELLNSYLPNGLLGPGPGWARIWLRYCTPLLTGWHSIFGHVYITILCLTADQLLPDFTASLWCTCNLCMSECTSLKFCSAQKFSRLRFARSQHLAWSTRNVFSLHGWVWQWLDSVNCQANEPCHTSCCNSGLLSFWGCSNLLCR